MNRGKKNILVTGSSGTIGTALCESLLARGYQLTGIDIRHNKWSNQIDKLTIISDLRRVNFHTVLKKDFDLIIHLAANARVYDLVRRPKLARDNFLMVFNVLEYARSRDIKRLIFASSREVYGNSDNACRKENEVSVSSCESPYSATKLGGEALFHSYSYCYDVVPVILRFSNVYGKYDDSDRVIPIFMRRAMNNKSLIVFGEQKTLDFTYIDDCINGITHVVKNFDRDGVKGNTFNIASGKGTSIMQVADIVKARTGSNSRIVIGGSRTGEVTNFIADITKARKLLGYDPKVNIQEGIEKSIEWYKGYK
jgi:nucleoside-diphosphate-sugar epimerase